MTPYLLVWICSFLALDQSSQTDSIKSIVESSKNDSLKALNLYNLSKHYYTFDQDSAILIAKSALELSKAKGFSITEAKALNLMGVIYLIKSEYEKSLSTHFEALDIRESIQDSVGITESQLNIGNIYYRLNEPEKAVVQYNKSLQIAELINNERVLSLLYNNLGSYYRDRWLIDKDDEDYRKAIEYLLKSEKIKENTQDKRGLINTLKQLGELYYESGKKEEAIYHLKKSLQYSEELNNTEGRLSSLGQLANYHKENNTLNQALGYAKQAYDISLETNSDYQIAIAAKRMADLSVLTDDYKNAFEYLVIHQARNDSIFNESRQKIRDELEIQYQSEKTELENQKLIEVQALTELSITRKNELLWISIIAAIFLVILVWYQQESNKKLLKAHQELEAINITVRSQNQQIKQQATNLNKTNQALSLANKFHEKLFSIISHDLRAPFASLNNSLDLWQSGDLSLQEMDYILSNVSRDTRSASTLLSNLLTWARTQMSSDQIQRTDINISELIEENKLLFEKQLDQKRQNITNLVSQDTIISTDRDRLNFIIRNILSNSIKFTPDGGEISIINDPKAPKTILIKDNGIGMTQNQIDSLFDKKQFSTIGTNGEPGTGIGLMLCKDFAESIGATISVSSILGDSTTFKIELG